MIGQIRLGPITINFEYALPQLDDIQLAIADILNKENSIMSTGADVLTSLNAAVASLAGEEVKEVGRYEAILTLLKANPDATGVQAAITQIQGVVTDLQSHGVTAAPAPAPTPAPTPEPTPAPPTSTTTDNPPPPPAPTV